MTANADALVARAKVMHERARKAQEEARKIAAKVAAGTGSGRPASMPTVAAVADAQGGV